MQGTLSLLGQAAGTAAVLCLQHDCTPRELGQKHIVELQQTLLKHDQYIPELKNEDPLDLARTARVTASSTAAFEEFKHQKIKIHDNHLLNMPRTEMFPAASAKRLSRCSPCYLLAVPSRGGTTRSRSGVVGRFSRSKTWQRPRRRWPPDISPGQISRRLPCTRPYVWFSIGKTPDVSWALMQGSPGSCRAYGGTEYAWSVHAGQNYACYTEPPDCHGL